jgi:uncharacterized DUF497 family protein
LTDSFIELHKEISYGFEWDDSKSAQCLRERGFTFAFVLPAFVDPHRRVEIDERHEYGETRYRLYGRIDGRLFVVAYAMRGHVVRIISARKAKCWRTEKSW